MIPYSGNLFRVKTFANCGKGQFVDEVGGHEMETVDQGYYVYVAV